MEESQENMSMNILKNLKRLEKYTAQDKIKETELEKVQKATHRNCRIHLRADIWRRNRDCSTNISTSWSSLTR
jgi:hypothetical protein